ncbi:MAG: hypothetical protein CSA21_02515 [Deltaproteobacteria bacterium]|nr:MAG: hypothetical protein CSA21_02515 [Deltaproteobacteria bacterium]
MRYRKIIIFFCLLVVLGGGLAMAAKDRAAIRHRKEAKAAGLEAFYNKSAALVIGNGHYKHGWSRLPGALEDVDEVAAALKKHGFAVTLKKDLTRSEFDQVLLNFIAKYGRDANNRLLVYYSGHGHTEDLPTGGQAGYLVMVDAKPPRDMVGFSMGSVPMESLLRHSRIIASKHVLFVFDSCFSGNILNARSEPTPDYVTDAVKRPVRQFITSGSAEEPVPDRSIFKDLFLDMINGERPEPLSDGYLTGEELGLYLKQKLPGYNPNQHPQYGKINNPRLDKGDFIFFLKPSGSSGVSEPSPEIQLPMRAASLEVRTQPGNARVRILNIRPRYRAGMALAAGRYHVEVSASGYQTIRRWVELGTGQNLVLDMQLLRKVIAPAPAPVAAPEPAVFRPASASSSTFTDPVTGMEFVLVKGDCYSMGSTSSEAYADEKPRAKDVCVDDFYMGKYEVTNAQYRVLVPGHDSGDYKGKSLDGDRQPVVNVSWNDAQEYIRKLNRKSGRKYRLPTEAEWEYAARGGTTTERFWGSSPDDACAYANVSNPSAKRRFGWDWDVHSCEDNYLVSAPVGSFRPNGYGLYDMLGNVWEWCQDRWHDSYKGGPTDGSAWETGDSSNRVERGGGWYGNQGNVRAANRSGGRPGIAYDYLGFRLVLPVHGQ